MTCPYARRLGPFALDVDDAESDLIERHLDTCRTCQVELAELARVADVLAVVRGVGAPREDEVPRQRQDADPPEDLLLGRVLDAIAAERAASAGPAVPTPPQPPPQPHSQPQAGRRTGRRLARPGRRTVLALVAAAVLLGGTATGVAIWDDSAGTGSGTLVARSDLGVRATATIAPHRSGARIDMVLSGLPPMASCRLVARAGDGQAETVATWRVTYQDTFRFEATTSIPATDLASLDVIDTRGRRLATFTPTPDD